MDKRPGVFRIIIGVILPVAIMFIISLLIYLGATAVYATFFSDSTDSLNVFMTKNNSLISIVALVISAVIFYFMFRRDRVPHSNEFLKKPIYFVPVFLIGCLISHGLSILISLINIDGIIGSYETASEDLFAGGIILIIIRIVILGPVVEELVFRGLVYNRIKKYLNFWPAALISSAIFGIYHLNLAQGIYAFLTGIMLCLVYDRFRNILAPIVLHAAANLQAVVIEKIQLTYPSILIYIVVMAVCLAGAFALYFFTVRKRS